LLRDAPGPLFSVGWRRAHQQPLEDGKPDADKTLRTTDTSIIATRPSVFDALERRCGVESR